MKRTTSYIIGFVLSVAFTVAAYFLVLIHVNSEHGFISHPLLLFGIFTLAFLQLVTQLFFFLHLGRGSRWEIGMFLITAVLILIVVIGSLWIMYHLNYNMTPAELRHYLESQQGGF